MTLSWQHWQQCTVLGWSDDNLARNSKYFNMRYDQQQSAVSRWRVVHRLQVQGIYSTLCTGGTGLGNMSWCQYPVPSISTAGLLHAWLIHSDNICTHSCFYTTLAQNCEILNRILNSILWGRKHHWFSFREAASFLCRFSFNLRYILVWSLYRTEQRAASSLQQKDESPSVNTAEY